MADRLFDTYKNSMIPHGRNIYLTESYIEMEKCVHIHHPIMHCHTVYVC